MAGRTTGAMVYGVVQYDFNAERADELDAKAGEAIIVVAQSNPEWFVAKPIGRLGGPGLIPVSFVDIKDTATMQSVPDPLEAVRKAGVPRVEEWKKFAAEYKNSSISLGKFDNGQPPNQMTLEMARMSLQNGGSEASLASNNFVSLFLSMIDTMTAAARLILWQGTTPTNSTIPTTVEYGPGADQCSRASILFCQRHVLVYHRVSDGGRTMVGIITILCRLLRLSDCPVGNVPRRGG